MATGNYPGKAHTIAQVRQDIEKVMTLVPGKQRLNLHAIYGEFGGVHIDRDQIEIGHFQGWIDWAKRLGVGLDFNPTCFSHPFADEGYTLSSKNEKIRKFWIEHVKRTRKIAAEMGRQLGSAAGNNIWIPDGSKDIPVDRNGHRKILKESLDEIFDDVYPPEHLRDTLESKLFGIGSESMVVGSHEFYLSYAVKNHKSLCIDTGHFHPTEQIGDKLSALLLFVDELLLHVSRGVRWDSDHVVTLTDEVKAVASEIARAAAWGRVHVATDYFDASINRVAAWVIGARATLKAILLSLLEPTELLRKEEAAGNFTRRLALIEEVKDLPAAAVWDRFCEQQRVPTGPSWLEQIAEYERSVLSSRR